MGMHIEEKRLIDLPKLQCEERLLAFGKKEYELKNHVQDEKESRIVFQTKTVLTAKEQRLTVVLNKKDDNNTEITLRAELVSNIAAKNVGALQKNLDNLWACFDSAISEEQPENGEQTKTLKSPRSLKVPLLFGKDQRHWDMNMMVTYLGGHQELHKSLRGSLAIYPDGVDFCVLGPKFTLFKAEIKRVTICSSVEIAAHSQWQASCLTGALDRNWQLNDVEKEKEKTRKNKIIIDYTNAEGLSHCIFRAEGQFELEKSLHKAEQLINNLIII